MMHFEDTIVTIVDSNRKTLKEYESEKIPKGRKSKVFIPFDSEYQFLIKNNNDTRIKLDIEIDGSLVTNEGLIISSFQTAYLERFLNSNEKFKFVKANNEAVSDPTSVENGIIKVRVYKEIKPWSVHHPYILTTTYPRGLLDTTRYLVAPSSVMYGVNGINSRSLNSENIGNVCNYSASISNMVDPTLSNSNNDLGATVGGTLSNQKFSETTWNGDNGVETCFTFIMRGTRGLNSKEAQIQFEKMQQYIKLKQELGL